MANFTILCIEDLQFKLNLLPADLTALKEKVNILFTIDTETNAQTLNKILQQNKQIALIICGQTQNKAKTLALLNELQQLSIGKEASTLLVNCELDIQFMIQVVNISYTSFCLTSSWQKEELYHVIMQQLNKHSKIQQQEQPDNTGSYKDTHLTYTDNALSQKLATELQNYFHNDPKNRNKQAFYNYEPNAIFTQEGTPNDYLWFVIEGEISLFKKDISGNTYQLSSLGKGSLIGSMSFISGELCFSTSIAHTHVQAIRIDRSTFNDLLLSKHALLPLFTRYLLRHFNHRLKNSISTEITLQQTLKSLELAHNELIHKEKMAMLGQLVAGVAHELNNPISAILSNTENLKNVIPELIHNPLTEITRYKAKQIMANALISHPTSTAEIRTKCDAIANKITNRNIARKVVNMGIADELDKWIEHLGNDLSDTLNKWEKFYQAGSLLRANLVCAKRIAEMVKSLKGYARQDTKSTQLVNLHEGIEDTLVIFENRVKQVDFIKNYADLAPIYCKPIELQQVWTNLIANALDAINDQGEIQITTRKCQYLSQDSVEVTITDNGVGIPFEHQHKIFELNFTTKSEGNFGLGIGLSICQQIIKDHKGIIEVRSEPNKYTAMSVILPYQSSILSSRENIHE